MDKDDWKDIAPAKTYAADNVRRADPSHPLDFYRGRDFSGRYIFSLAADPNGRSMPDPPKLNGIDTALERSDTETLRLLLTLQDQKHYDIFRSLCDHLLTATSGLTRGANADGMKLVLRRLSDWHEMLRRLRENLLSLSERIGLAGELLFLRDIVMPHLSLGAAAASWRGGHRDQQDFAVGTSQFEIKTQLSTSDQRLLISSEAQLDTAGSQLFLCHQAFASGASTGDTFTLSGLVQSLRETFASAGTAAKEAFDEGLEEWGYVPHDEYNVAEWILTDRRFFEVSDTFPRIVPAMLPDGVEKVEYQILLRYCEPFSIDASDVVRKVFS